MSNLKQQDINEQINAFFARGGSVTQVAEGERSIDPKLSRCLCGCNGNFTDHSMRAGESGRCSSVVIR